MSGRNARGLRKMSDGSKAKYRFAKKYFRRNRLTHKDVREALNDPAA